MEYGYSCMGYEIPGGLGVKMARPDREVVVMVGDGSYLMLNNEITTSIMLDKKLIIVLLDNRGYGCINRLQQGCGGAPFNNMLVDSLQFGEGAPKIDFAANAALLVATSEKVANISTSWQVLNAFGTSKTTQPTSGSYPQTNRPQKLHLKNLKRSTRGIQGQHDNQ
jgi:3D-(3,5/4)-trihydroxycyclohexane-1,2-dione acylhydrolase (decyclizing)